MRHAPDPRRPMTLEDYLVFEERSPIKHEYVAGEVYAMSGVTTRHNLITLNLVTRLRGPARTRGCRVFATDVKLRTADRVYYPDAMVACGKAAEVELIIEEPSFIAEVSSRSTRATDRREKLEAYKKIVSLRCYLIIDQRRKHVIAYTRDAGGEWARAEIEGDGEVTVPGLDLRLTLEEIYEDVPLPPLRVREGEEWDAEEWLDAEVP
jgi:Uma2 family endonuclease